MLKIAYLETDNKELSRLILEGNYKYYSFTSYEYYDRVELDNDEWNTISRVSVDDCGNILGYFSASTNRTQQKITSMSFVKFRYKFNEYGDNDRLESIVGEDLNEFIEEIMTHPILKLVKFSAIKDNPANKTYNKWIEKYGGKRYLYEKSVMLRDGLFYDVWGYYFCRRT